MSLIQHTLQHIKQRDLTQKIGIAYCVLIFLCALIFPIIHIQQINSTDVLSIRLIHWDFALLDMLFVTVLVKCAIYLASIQYKSLVLHVTGLKMEWYAVPLICFVLITCIMLSIGTTTLVLKEHVTYMIDLAYGYYILCVLLIVGLWVIAVMMIKHMRTKPQWESLTITPKPKPSTKTTDITTQHTNLSSQRPRSSLFEDI